MKTETVFTKDELRRIKLFIESLDTLFGLPMIDKNFAKEHREIYKMVYEALNGENSFID